MAAANFSLFTFHFSLLFRTFAPDLYPNNKKLHYNGKQKPTGCP